MTESTQRIVLNGIHGTTGRYLIPPLGVDEVTRLASPESERSFFDRWRERLRQLLTGISFGVSPDVDPLEVPFAGWGVVFPREGAAAIRKALEPLVAHRRAQVEPDRFHVLTYEPGETAEQFLSRHGTGVGDVEPTLVPYYLLLVGGPEEIPYEVQHSLSLAYAVGRVAFDTPEEYGRYAASVVAYESGSRVPGQRQVVLWGPRHVGDQATELSADHLLTPLAAGDSSMDRLGFTRRSLIGPEATKAALAEVLHGRGVRPAVLLTASHGLGFEPGDSLQRSRQGALLCQDWTGFGSIATEHSLAAADVAEDAQVHGLVAFFFACFGAGTPLRDEFPLGAERKPGAQIAPKPFVSAFPQRLLAHPQGGALAVIGHVDRSWGFSLQPVGVEQPTVRPFRNTLWRLLSGEPVGHALSDFRDRFSAVSSLLLQHLDASSTEGKLQPRELLRRWVERNDARNYVVLGDPAVRLRVGELQGGG
jgi:hypothetical protein